MISIRKIIAPSIVGGLAMAFGGCASTPPENSRLSQLDAQLKTAAADKYVAEYGQADLTAAGTSLTAAHAAQRASRFGELQHDMNVAEDYITLGNIHGQQERVKAETVALKDQQDQLRLASRDSDVRRANERADVARTDANTARSDASTARSDADSARMDAMVANTAVQSAEDKMAAMRTQLAIYDVKITQMGATLVLHDVMFDTDSATLREGSVDRLAPLATYLRSSPATSVHIEGYTDNTGSIAHNNDLSLNRADAVKRALMSGAGITNAVETTGSGENKPVASNATVSGREQNRRVEITLQ